MKRLFTVTLLTLVLYGLNSQEVMLTRIKLQIEENRYIWTQADKLPEKAVDGIHPPVFLDLQLFAGSSSEGEWIIHFNAAFDAPFQ